MLLAYKKTTIMFNSNQIKRELMEEQLLNFCSLGQEIIIELQMLRKENAKLKEQLQSRDKLIDSQLQQAQQDVGTWLNYLLNKPKSDEKVPHD